jgi:serine/threonine protein kinase
MRPRLQSHAVRALNGTVSATTRIHGPPGASKEEDEISVAMEEEDRPTDPDGMARERAMALLGRVVSGRYRIDHLLGMGGMGAVYRGYHLLLKKPVAIKVLHANIKRMPDLRARFEREAIAGAHVVHPHVVEATDFGQLEDGSYFLVLEYVAGETLHDLIHRVRITPARAVAIARQIAGALAATHAMGIVHRDLKPSNVMLVEGPTDHAKIIDFGLAKVPVDLVLGTPQAPESKMSPGTRLTGTGVIFGTVAYLAPEAAAGMDGIDARADLYALGVILYQMLAGRHPFDAVASTELFAQHRFQKPRPLAEMNPTVEVPPELEALVMRLLAKDPAARHASSGELIEALDALGLAPPSHRPESGHSHAPSSRPEPEHASSTAATVAHHPELPRRTRRSWRIPVALAACALVAAMCAYVFGPGASSPAAVSPASPTAPEVSADVAVPVAPLSPEAPTSVPVVPATTTPAE